MYFLVALFRPVDDKCMVHANLRVVTDRNINGLLKWLDSFMNEKLQVLLGKGDVDLSVGLLHSRGGQRGGLHWQVEQDW